MTARPHRPQSRYDGTWRAQQAVWEPVLSQENLLLFACSCGWQSDRIRPEQSGGWRAICQQAQAHLDAQREAQP